MKTILVTGATDGIGKQVAFQLAGLGNKVIIHGRNEEKVQRVLPEILQQFPRSELGSAVGEFTDFNSLKRMAHDLFASGIKLDVLVNNAGVFNPDYELLSNGIEKTFMVNYLAPYYLTRMILGDLVEVNGLRVVNVSSMAQTGNIDFDNLMGQKTYDAYEAYALSKLCNVLFTYKLHRIYSEMGVQAICLHPGVINTKLLRAGWGLGGGQVEAGAAREVFAACADDATDFSGVYLVNNQIAKSAGISYDKRIQDHLWDLSSHLCGLDYK